MKIWFQKHIVSGRLPGLDRAYAAHFRRVARPGTEVHLYTLPPDAYAGAVPEALVRTHAVESLFAGYFALQALRAERAGYEAFVIGTSQDPGLVEARAWARIPVLGFGQVAAHVASVLGARFGHVGFIAELADPIRVNLLRDGLAHRWVGFHPLGTGPRELLAALDGDAAPFREAFTAAAHAAIAAGAEVLIPGDGVTNEALVAAGLDAVDGVPVIDANGLLVKAAELFVDLRTLGVATPPTTGYAHSRPDDTTTAHLLRLFAPRAFTLDEDPTRRREEGRE
jgi:allantoin racemase